MSLLLDTNVCIGIIDGSRRLRDRLTEAVAFGDEIWTSSIVVFELWSGVQKSRFRSFNTDRLSAFLSGPFGVLPFDGEDAEYAGRIRGELRKAGRPIGPYDVLIAGQALNRTLTLATANTREFSRIDGLGVQDWSTAAV